MSPEITPEKNKKAEFEQLVHDLEAAAKKIDGHYVKKLSEVDEEIEVIDAWPSNVILGPIVKRKGQELLALKRLRLEIQISREHVVPMLAIIIKQYSDPKPPILD